MNAESSTDRIERSVVIHAPRERVWRALSNAEQFGTWFGARLHGQSFAPGQRARGPIAIPGFEHVFFDVLVESGFDKVPPQRRQEAFRMNSGGWEAQIRNIVRYVSQ